MMDTNPSGIDSARQSGRHETALCAATRRTLVAALMVVALAPGARTTTAQAAEIEVSVLAPLATQSLMLDAVALDDRLVAVGERGHILISRRPLPVSNRRNRPRPGSKGSVR